MDLNLVVIFGRLAAVPELRLFDSGMRLLRMLVTVRSDSPRSRIDVVPVTLWDPPEELIALQSGSRVWITGSVQRRFWDAAEGRRSRLEVVASQVKPREVATEDPVPAVPTLS